MSSLHHWAELRARSIADQVQRSTQWEASFPYSRTPQDIPMWLFSKVFLLERFNKCCQHVRSFDTTLFDAVLASLSNDPGRFGPQKICFTECSQRIAEGTEIIRWTACCYIQIQRQTCPGWEDEDPYASWALIYNQKSGCERWCRPHAKWLCLHRFDDCLFHLVITGMIDDMFQVSSYMICIPDSAGDVECTFVDPCALLWHLCRNSESFSGFMEAEMARIPTSQSQPWSLVLYSDEVSPGNSLKPDNRRNSCTETPVFFLVLLYVS